MLIILIPLQAQTERTSQRIGRGEPIKSIKKSFPQLFTAEWVHEELHRVFASGVIPPKEFQPIWHKRWISPFPSLRQQTRHWYFYCFHWLLDDGSFYSRITFNNSTIWSCPSSFRFGHPWTHSFKSLPWFFSWTVCYSGCSDWTLVGLYWRKISTPTSGPVWGPLRLQVEE